MNKSFNVKAFLDHDSETFSYVVFDAVNHVGVIIDPVLDFDYKSGRTSTISAQKILDFVKFENIQVKWILETHAHADHLSAAPFLKDTLNSKIGIGAHIQEVQVIFKDIFNLEKEFLPNGNQFDHLFQENEILKIGSMEIRILHTPGHTPADIAYIINEQAAFVGDTLFMPDIGTARCDFPGGDAGQLYDSIQKILCLNDDTEIYICHDYPPDHRSHTYLTTVADQKQNNIHISKNTTREKFIEKRLARDATLAMPRLILPSVQVNIRAGQMPPRDEKGKTYLKVPINLL